MFLTTTGNAEISFVLSHNPADSCLRLYELFIEPLRSFYANERKFLLVFKAKLTDEPSLWYAAAALACFVVAVVAAAVGTLFTTAAVVNPQQHPTLHAIGLISLILALPIFILGGHCLDLNDRNRSEMTKWQRKAGST